MPEPMTALQLARVAKESNGDCFFENKPVFVRSDDGFHGALDFVWDETLGGFVISIADERTEVPPSLPEEPQIGAVLQDDDGDVWMRHTDGWRFVSGTVAYDWAKVASHSPLTRLVPDPADDAPELPWKALGASKAVLARVALTEGVRPRMVQIEVMDGDYLPAAASDIAAAILRAVRDARRTQHNTQEGS